MVSFLPLRGAMRVKVTAPFGPTLAVRVVFAAPVTLIRTLPVIAVSATAPPTRTRMASFVPLRTLLLTATEVLVAFLVTRYDAVASAVAASSVPR